MLHRSVRRFDIPLEIVQCLTEISLKFTWKSAILAKVGRRMPWSYGKHWSLTLSRWGETRCVLRSAFGCPLFCFSPLLSLHFWLGCLSSSRSALSISEGEGEESRIRSPAAHAPPMRVRANAWMSTNSSDPSFLKISAIEIVRGSISSMFVEDLMAPSSLTRDDSLILNWFLSNSRCIVSKSQRLIDKEVNFE